MKSKLFFLLSTVIFLLPLDGEEVFSFSPSIPRKIVIGKKTIMNAVVNGKVNFDVTVPEKAAPAVKQAAAELCYWLGKIFGQEIKPVAVSGKDIVIAVGDQTLARKNGIDTGSFDRDGFVIRSFGKTVLIAGRDSDRYNPRKSTGGYDVRRGMFNVERATLFGVYDFLERFTGMRFYFPVKEGVFLPEIKNWDLPEMDIYDRPDWIQRFGWLFAFPWSKRPLYYPREYKELHLNLFNAEADVRLWNRWQSIRLRPTHGLSKLGYKQRFGKSHPEYFAIDPAGKRVADFRHLCFSSNIREEIYRDAASFLKGEPASKRGVISSRNKVEWDTENFIPGLPIFDIMPDDGMIPCCCDKCRPITMSAEKTSEQVWNFIIDCAERLKREKIPGYLSILAYAPYDRIPKRQIPDNVLVWFFDRGPWNAGNPELMKKQLAHIRAWAEKCGGRIAGVYNHWLKFPGGILLDLPCTTHRAIAAYYKEIAPLLRSGCFVETQTDRFVFQYLNWYIFSKFAWNNKCDTEALLKEHFDLLFGPAAKEMDSIYRKWENIFLSVNGNIVNTPLGPQVSVPPNQELWEKFYSPAVRKEIDILFDRALDLTRGNKTYHDRIEFFRKNMWGPLCQSVAQHFKIIEERNKHNCRSAALKPGEEIKIDGIINEKAWQNSPAISLIPFKKGGKADVSTVVRLRHDSRYLYIGVECSEPDISAVQNGPQKQDDPDSVCSASTFEIFLNPDMERKDHYQFVINPAGTSADFRVFGKIAVTPWNNGLAVRTKITPRGWTAEIRIRRISMSGGERNSFAVNFARVRLFKDQKKNKTKIYSWVPGLSALNETESYGTLFLK